MDVRGRWPILDELCRCADRFPNVEVWTFGSMLRSPRPNDLDVLIIYKDRLTWWLYGTWACGK
jgi:hypothetical protein